MVDTNKIWQEGERGPEEIVANPSPATSVSSVEGSDPFEGRDIVPGLEHLGRAIVDAYGVPSGSPANYEFLRGRGDITPEQIQSATNEAVAHMQDLFPANDINTQALIGNRNG